MSKPSRKPTPGDLVHLSQRLDQDKDLPLRELEERDRDLQRSLPSDANDSAILLQWLETFPKGSDQSQRIDRARGLGILLLGVVSLLSGLGTGLALFRYDGTTPINIVPPVLSILTLQGLSLLLALVLMNRGFAAGRSSSISELLLVFSPGRWLSGVLRFCNPATREAYSTFQSAFQRHQILFSHVYKWTIFQASQVAAVMFFIGITLGFLGLFLSTDLAFAWSTTIEVNDSWLHRATRLLTLPFASIIPSAAPSLELIESTRYFRLDDGGYIEKITAEKAGLWWPFVLCMLSFYGVLPRLVCCVLAHYCLKHHLGSSFKTLPGASDVLARMRSPIIESITRDQQETVPDSDESKTPATPGFDPQSAKAFLSWNKAHLASADFRDPEKTPVTSIGAPHTVEEDKTALDAFTTQHAKVSPLILTKSWEPPTGEFLDLVSELRKRLPSHCPIFILPIATDNDQAYLIDIAIWKRSLRKLADPYLTVIQQSKEKDRL